MKSKRQKKINVKKILKSNPTVDKKLYEAVQKEQIELKSLGFKRSQYNLVIPFVRSIYITEKSI